MAQHSTAQHSTDPQCTAYTADRGVSVIIPVYNREQYLAECIESVKQQETDFPVEIILADDGSTDRSLEIIRSYVEQSTETKQIVLVEKPPTVSVQGAGPTRNRGIAVAKYAYIAFLDSDDVFLPRHLKRLFDALESNPDIAFVFDEQNISNSNGSAACLRKYPQLIGTEKLNEVFMGQDFFVQTDSVMVRKSVFAAIPLDDSDCPFNAELRMGQDIDLWLRITEKYSFQFVRGVGSQFRIHEEQSMKNQRRCYEYRQKVVDMAVRRYPYPVRIIHKQKAVIQYHLAKCDIAEKKFFSASVRLLYAFFLDPIRAISTIIQRKFD